MQQGGGEYLVGFFVYVFVAILVLVSFLFPFGLLCLPFFNKLLRARCKVYFQTSYRSEFFLLVRSSIHSSELQWELCMSPGYLCKSSRCMWLVSLSFESQLSTEECISLPSPGLFSVSHPRGTVSNNTQSVQGDPSAAELSCANSLETSRTLPPEFSPPAEQNSTLLYLFGCFGLPCAHACSSTPFKFSPNQKCRDSKACTRLPHIIMVLSAWQSDIGQKY